MLYNDRNYFIYISTNKRNNVLYIGVTNNILSRDDQHKKKINKNSFTARYNIDKVVYYETYGNVAGAIAREKQLKGWTRQKKIDLISSINPKWEDLVKKSWGDDFND